jgi:NAD(P)H dehydrogenase (quinone)
MIIEETHMKFHIIIDHPWTGSFNYAILEAFSDTLQKNGHTIDLLDLNQDEFNPVFTTEELAVYAQGLSLDPKVKDYQARLMSTEHLVLVFPIWWNVMPARMKGWLDKVLLPGFAFTRGQTPEPLLTHISSATILTTTGAPDELHREEYNNALHWVLGKGVFDFCGINAYEWLNFGETGFAPKEDHAAWLDRVRAFASKF